MSEMRQVMHAHDDLTAEVVRQCHGTILKDTGDDVFGTFPS
jgi:class 3 adenylate cyclase